MPRTIVLIVVDSLRKDTFDKYATGIKQQADISFDRCHAPSSWSVPSHASIVTGKLPSEHGVHAHNMDLSALGEQKTFFPAVSGRKTVGVSSNIFAGTPYGFDSYFDDFTSVSRHSVFADGLSIDQFLSETDQTGAGRYIEFLRKAAADGVLGKSLVNGVSLKLDEATRGLPIPRFKDYGTNLISRKIEERIEEENPSFIFANMMEVHAPLRAGLMYDWGIQGRSLRWHSEKKNLWTVNNDGDAGLHDEYLENYRDIYNAAAEYVDRRVTSLIERVIETHEDVTFIITADHGENLGYSSEGGLLGHVGDLNNSLTHVPLAVVNSPSTFETREDDLVTLLDLPELIETLAQEEPVDIARSYVPAERVGLGLDDRPDNSTYWGRMIRRVLREDGVSVTWDSLGNAEQRNEGTVESIDEENLPSWSTDEFSVPIHEYKEKALRLEEETDVAKSTEKRLEDLGYL